MKKEENIENFDSLNEDNTDEQFKLEDIDLEEEDVETLKEKLTSISEKNKKLFERAKKAEGFTKEDGKWVKKKPEPKPKPKADETIKENDIELRVNKILEKRDIEALDLSDELKEQVQTYAKVSNVSIKKALDSDYIQFLKEKDDKKRETEEASLGGKQRGGTTKKDYTETDFKATDFDLSTPEGKASFEEAKNQWRKSMGQK